MEKSYYLVGECKEGVADLKGKKAEGFRTQFPTFNGNITYKFGTYCVIAAAPASGKSFFALSECLHQARAYDHRSFVFSPELGSKEEIIALLVHMYTGKSVMEIPEIETIGEGELGEAMKWLNNYFVIYEPPFTPTMDQIFESIEDFQDTHKKKINFFIVDNINDTKEPSHSQGRQDLAVEEMLVSVHRMVKKHDSYAFLLTHASNQGAPLEQNGIKFYGPITPRQIRSGEAIYRKAFLLITIWRPPEGLNGPDGQPYLHNEAHIIVLKAKPAFTALKGFVGKSYFDWKKSSFTDVRPTSYMKIRV